LRLRASLPLLLGRLLLLRCPAEDKIGLKAGGVLPLSLLGRKLLDLLLLRRNLALNAAAGVSGLRIADLTGNAGDCGLAGCPIGSCRRLLCRGSRGGRSRRESRFPLLPLVLGL